MEHSYATVAHKAYGTSLVSAVAPNPDSNSFAVEVRKCSGFVCDNKKKREDKERELDNEKIFRRLDKEYNEQKEQIEKDINDYVDSLDNDENNDDKKKEMKTRFSRIADNNYLMRPCAVSDDLKRRGFVYQSSNRDPKVRAGAIGVHSDVKPMLTFGFSCCLKGSQVDEDLRPTLAPPNRKVRQYDQVIREEVDSEESSIKFQGLDKLEDMIEQNKTNNFKFQGLDKLKKVITGTINESIDKKSVLNVAQSTADAVEDVLGGSEQIKVGPQFQGYLGDAVNSVKKVYTGLQTLGDNKEKVDNIVDNVSVVTGALADVTRGYNNVIDCLKSIPDHMKTLGKKAIDFVVKNLHRVINMIAHAPENVIRFIKYITDVVKDLLGFKVEPESNVEYQAMDATTPVVTLASCFVCYLLSSFGIVSWSFDIVMSKFSRVLSMFVTVEKLNLQTKLLNVLCAVLDVMPEVVRTFIVANVLPNEWGKYYVEYIDDYDELTVLCKWMNEKFDDGTWEDRENLEKFRSSYERAKVIYARLHRDFFSKTNGIKGAYDTKWFAAHEKTLKNLGAYISRCLVPRGERMRPHVVWLHGESRIGKSKFSSYLAKKMLPYVTDDEICTFVEKSSGFWDNYNPRAKVIIFDDAFITQETVQTTIEYLQYMVSNNECPINKADISDKGLRFGAQLIIVCSNNKEITLTQHYHEQAIWNRRDIVANVKLERDFGMQAGEKLILDREKLNKHKYKEYYPHLTFDIQSNIKGDTQVHVSVDAVDFCTGCYVACNAHLAAQEKLLQQDDDMKEQVLPPRNWRALAKSGTRSAVKSQGQVIKQMFSEDVLGSARKLVFNYQGTQSSQETEQEVDTSEQSEQSEESENEGYEDAQVDEEVIIAKQHADFWSKCRYNTHRAISTLKKILDNTQKTIKDFIEKHPIMSSVLAAVGVMGSGLAVVAGVTRTVVGLVGQTSDDSRWKKHQNDRGRVRAPHKRGNKIVHNMRPQNLTQEQVVEIARSMNKNMLIIQFGTTRTFAFGLGGRLALIPRHTLKEMTKFHDYTVTNMETGQKVNGILDPKQIIDVAPNCGLVGIIFTASLSSMPSFRKKMATEADIDDHLERAVCPLFCYDLAASPCRLELIEGIDAIDSIKLNHNGYKERDDDCFMYKDKNYPGKCMSPLFLVRGDQPLILGAHIAGDESNNMCLASFVSKELVDKFVRLSEKRGFNYQTESMEYMYTKTVSGGEKGTAGPVIILGDTKPVYSSAVGKTHIRKSKMQGKHELWQDVKCGPSVLRQHDIRLEEEIKTVFDKPFKSQTQQAGPFKYTVIKQATESVKEVLYKLEHKNEVRVYKLEEALNGIPGELNGIDIAKGSGFDGRLCGADMKATKKGHHVTGTLEQHDMELKQDMKNLYDERLARLKKGWVPATVFMDNPKDELRPLDKIAQGSTRIFSGDGMVNTLICKQYFGSFVGFLVDNATKCFSTCGMDDSSLDWNKMIARGVQNSQYGFGGDYRKYDKKLPAEIIHATIEIVNKWYELNGNDSTEDAQVRSALLEGLIHSYHVNPYITYRAFQGMPSGHYLTMIINSICNAIMFRTAWIECNLDIKEYNDNVVDFYRGDDNILSVKEPYLRQFNFNTVQQYYKTIGLDFTASDKTDNKQPDYKKFVDLDFVSTFTRYDEEIRAYVPLIKYDNFAKSVQFFKVGSGLREVDLMEQRIQCMVQFLFWYGKEEFDKWMKPVSRVFRETYGRPLVVDDYPLLFAKKVVDYKESNFRGTEPIGKKMKLNYDEIEISENIKFMYQGYEVISEIKTDAESEVQCEKCDYREIVNCSERYQCGRCGYGYCEVIRLIWPEKVKRVVKCMTCSKLQMLSDDERFLCDDCNGFMFCYQSKQVPLEIVDTVAHPQQEEEGKTTEGIVKVIEDAVEIDPASVQVEEKLIRNVRVTVERPRMYSGEIDWNLEKLLGRYYVMQTFTWGAQAVNDEIVSRTLPDTVQTLNRFTEFIFKKFMYFRTTMTVKVDLAGTKFHQGKLLGVWAPLRSDKIDNLCVATFLDHMEINASNPVTNELTIPFRYPLDYLTDNDSLGAFKLIVMNPLKHAGTSATTLNGVISIRFDSLIVHVPRGTGTSTFEGQSGIEDTLKDIPVVGPILGQIAKNVLPDNLTSTDIMSAASMLLDKPLLQMNDKTYIKRDISYTNHAVGFDNGQRMNMYPSETTVIDKQHFGTDKDEMDLGYLLSRKNYVNTVSINATQPAYTTIATFPISPILIWKRHQEAAQVISLAVTEEITYEVPMITHIANAFNFWRGGLRIYFDFIKTAFHQCKVAVIFHYGTPVKSTDNLEKTQMNHVVLAVKEQESFTVDVPYVYNTPFCNMHAFGLGVIELIVIEPLAVPNGVANTVDINISISACEDFQLNYIVDHPVIDNIQYQSTEVVSATGVSPKKQPIIHFTEKYNNLRDILKRYYEVVPENTLRATYNTIDIRGIHYVDLALLLTRSPSFAHFTCMYATYRGSIRVKALPGTLYKISFQPPHAHFIANAHVRMLRGMAEAASLARGRSDEKILNAVSRAKEGPHEIEVPYCSHYNILGNRNNSRAVATTMIGHMYDGGSLACLDNGRTPKYLVAGGDDLQFGIVNFIPKYRPKQSWVPVYGEVNVKRIGSGTDVQVTFHSVDKFGTQTRFVFGIADLTMWQVSVNPGKFYEKFNRDRFTVDPPTPLHNQVTTIMWEIMTRTGYFPIYFRTTNYRESFLERDATSVFNINYRNIKIKGKQFSTTITVEGLKSMHGFAGPPGYEQAYLEHYDAQGSSFYSGVTDITYETVKYRYNEDKTVILMNDVVFNGEEKPGKNQYSNETLARDWSTIDTVNGGKLPEGELNIWDELEEFQRVSIIQIVYPAIPVAWLVRHPLGAFARPSEVEAAYLLTPNEVSDD